MRVISGLVLDVDDTIYLERDYVRSGFQFLDQWCIDALGVSGVGARAWCLFEAGVRGSTITDALAERGVEPSHELVQRAVHAYRGHHPQISMLPDARDLRGRVSGVLPVSVVTDGPAASQRAKIAALRLDRWASPLVVTEEYGSAKPDPVVFRVATKSWGIPDHRLAYVGDNPTKDFEGPMALGWTPIRMRRPGSLHEALATPSGVLEITHFGDVRFLSLLMDCNGQTITSRESQ